MHSIVDMLSCGLLPVVGRIIIRRFGMSYLVCIVLRFVDISLIFPLSPLFSGLFPQVVLSFFLFAFSFLSLHALSHFYYFIFLAFFFL